MKTSKTVRIIIAGLIWAGVGVHLTHLGMLWLIPTAGISRCFSIGIGILVSLIIYGFGLQKTVDRNIRRIDSGPEKASVLSFIPVKSYLLISLMVLLGIILRHSGIPVRYRAVFYLTMGSALLISSIRYGWAVITRIRK